MYRVIPDNGICIGMGAENCVKYNTKCDSIVIRAFNKYNFIDFIKKRKEKKKDMQSITRAIVRMVKY